MWCFAIVNFYAFKISIDDEHKSQITHKRCAVEYKISSSLNQTTLSFNQASLLARVWLLILTIASGVGAIQELLHLLPVLDARLQNQPPPVNRNQPSNDVNGCEHLDDADHQLGFAPLVRVSQATANHGSGAGEDHVEDKADVGPNAAQPG